MIHLAELIEEEMQERGWTMNDLIMNMGPFFDEKDWGVCHLSWELFLTIREPNVLLGTAMAQQLGDAFGITPAFFLNFHNGWREAEMRKEVEAC